MDKSELSVKNLERALLELNQEQSEQIILNSAQISSPAETAGSLISEALTRIGDSWEKGNLALSQVYMSSLICEKIINKILPPQDKHTNDQQTIAIGVFEDYHLLGKRIIYSTLRASGINLIDLGGGLTIEKLVKEVEERKIEILLLSVLMLPSALRIKELHEKLSHLNVTLVVGGAPFRFDDKLSDEIGADYFGKDSADALAIINKLMADKT